jgi:rfaE bifunctional protein nucleotidyltransferase chain/domain
MSRTSDGDACRVVDGADAVQQVRAWQAAGLAVAATGGAFDLLHDGHLHLLTRARAAADRLLVTVHEDDRIRQSRGAGRPVHPAHERAELLAALKPVDLVTIVPGDDAAWIAECRPDVLVLSSDDTYPSARAAELLLPPHTRAVYVAPVPSESTSTLIARAQAQT